MILTDSVENRMMRVLAISNMGKNNSKGEEGGGERERERMSMMSEHSYMD